MHVIRLRGPWQVEPVERFVAQSDGMYRATSVDLPKAARARMPADWSEQLGDEFSGRVRYVRTFQKPTGLEVGQRVWLVIEPPISWGAVELNHKRLGVVGRRGGPGRFDVTGCLEPHNRLEIVVEHPALDEHGAANDDSNSQLAGGLVGEVRLEIED
jgi:hypothetical protein